MTYCLADILSSLTKLDADLLLAINGWRAGWADYFMYAFSGKLVWIPMYASILYVILRNMNWKLALGCIITVALTITFADQVCATLIRPHVARLRPANLGNPLSDFVQIVNGYRGGAYGFPSCHAANTFGLVFFVFYVFRNRVLTAFMVVWALITCYSRSYLGVHYPGDLLVGAVVGAAGASLCYWLLHQILHYEPKREFKHVYAPILVGGITIVGLFIYALVLGLFI